MALMTSNKLHMEQTDSIKVSLFWQQPAAMAWNTACLQICLNYLLST